MNKKEGISLIVLSITILIMAILAATAIIGLENTGIIGRSKNTVSQQNKTEEYTKLQVIKNGMLADNLGEITVDDYITKLKENGMIENSVTSNSYGNKIVQTKNGTTIYIQQQGEANIKIGYEPIKPTLGSLITSAADYGKTINYEANGVTKWKIFYKTKDNVYIIASEALGVDEMTVDMPNAILGARNITLEDGTTKTLRTLAWKSTEVPTTPAVIKNPKMWLANYGDYSQGEGAIVASYFLDETRWNVFKNTAASYSQYVKGAIGTPTAEMLVASWNEKRMTTNDTTTYNIQLDLIKNGGYYQINSAPMVRISTVDNLYVWYDDGTSSVWLATPMTGIRMVVLTNAGTLGIQGQLALNYPSEVRPVVCLSADTPAILGTTTDYEI